LLKLYTQKWKGARFSWLRYGDDPDEPFSEVSDEPFRGSVRLFMYGNCTFFGRGDSE
jgi:hypothetical protein